MKKTDAANAERAAEHYAIQSLDCVRTLRAVRTRFARQDLFASDVLGKRADGTLVAIQVTTGKASAVSDRKRRLEAVPWHQSDIVLLLQMHKEKLNGRSIRHFFRVLEYCVGSDGRRKWFPLYEVEVPRTWFRAAS